MTDPRPAHTCPTCGHDAGSKFALKHHKRHCTNGLPARTINHMADTASDGYVLATRPTKYHRFVS